MLIFANICQDNIILMATQFGECIRELRTKKNLLPRKSFKVELSKLQSLKTGLMQDLLIGKLRVNKLIKEAYGKI